MSIATLVAVATLWLAPIATCPAPSGSPRGGNVDFTEAFNELMVWEGAGKLHRDTRGILTKWGVSSSAYPELDIKNLTKEEAMEIARADYWKPSGAFMLPQYLRYPVFDYSYNAGVHRAVEALQWSMNMVVQARGKDWTMLAEDGHFGPNTAARSLALTSEADFVLRCFVYKRFDFYVDLAQRGSGFARSLNGWLRRALETVYETSPKGAPTPVDPQVAELERKVEQLGQKIVNARAALA